jgi:16S rRNA G966 N2-methylase RsmD
LTELVPAGLGPGLIPAGFSERVLMRAAEYDDPAALWDGATSLAALAHKWNGHGQEKNEIKAAQMFLEIELGQRLYMSEDSHGESRDINDIIPRPLASDLRRMYGYRDMLVDLVRNGKRSRRSLLMEIDRFYAASRPEPTTDQVDIRSGDFRDVLDVEPGSVTLILTDPPYPAEYLPLWDDLGKFGADVLVDGGSLVAYSGQAHLPEVYDRLRPHLLYWWTLALLHSHGSQTLLGKKVSAGWKPVVWFVKDRRLTQTIIPDRIVGTPPRKTVPVGDGVGRVDRDGDDWAQGVEELESVISGLTAPGDLIVDPFAGSGTTGLAAVRFGRRFMGADIS